jgi:DNA polymerase (family 10)
VTNHQVAELLDDLCRLSVFESKFKASAYERAAESIRRLDVPITKIHDLTNIEGVGNGIAKKIDLFMRTKRCRKLRELKRKYKHLLGLTDIPGIGATKAKELYALYGASSIGDVCELVRSGHIRDKRIIAGVHRRDPMSYGDAKDRIERLTSRLDSAAISQVTPCGSFRRREAKVGDLDIVILTNNTSEAVTAAKTASDYIIDDGKNKVTSVCDDIHVDFRFTDRAHLGAMLLHFTGDTRFNRGLRTRAKSAGMTLNEYGLHCGGDVIASRTEFDILSALGVQYVHPPDRHTEALNDRWQDGILQGAHASS